MKYKVLVGSKSFQLDKKALNHINSICYTYFQATKYQCQSYLSTCSFPTLCHIWKKLKNKRTQVNLPKQKFLQKQWERRWKIELIFKDYSWSQNTNLSIVSVALPQVIGKMRMVSSASSQNVLISWGSSHDLMSAWPLWFHQSGSLFAHSLSLMLTLHLVIQYTLMVLVLLDL